MPDPNDYLNDQPGLFSGLPLSISQALAQAPPPVEEMTGGGNQQPQETTLQQFQPTNAVAPSGPLSQARQMYPPGNPPRGPAQLPTILNQIGGEYVPQTGPTFSPDVRQQMVQQGYTTDQINQMQQGATTLPLAQARNQRAQQLAQIQQQLQTQELSGHENSRLQQMRLGLSRVQEAVDNGTLSSTEGNNLFLQLQSGIDPLQKRQQAAAAQAQQQQNQQRQMELDRQIAETQRRRERAAAGLPETTGRVQVAPGISAYGHYDDKGVFHTINPQHLIHDGPDGRLPVGSGAGTSGTGTTGTGSARGQEVTANRTAQVLQHVERSVDAELKAEFQNERPANYEDQRAARISARLPRAIEHFRQLQQGLNPPPVDPRDQPLSEAEGQRLSHLRGRYLTWHSYQQQGQHWPETPEETQHWLNEMRTLEQRYGLQMQRGMADRMDPIFREGVQRHTSAAEELTRHEQQFIGQTPTDAQQRRSVELQNELAQRFQVRQALSIIRGLVRTKALHSWTRQDRQQFNQAMALLPPEMQRRVNAISENSNGAQ